MRAIIHQGQGLGGLQLVDRAAPVPATGECLVRLRAAALNHRDIWVAKGREPTAPAVVLGSDGAGEVVDVGRGVRRPRVGDAVVVNPSLNWSRGDRAPPASFEILGHPRDGTFAELIALPAANLEPKPAHLDWAEAAALGLSGLTAWRALVTQGAIVPGATVAIPGIGGGTALTAMQIAIAQGARVFVTSTARHKRARAEELGAAAAFDSAEPWSQAVLDATGGAGADIVVESVGRATWAESLKSLARGGRLVVYGSTSGDVVETVLPPFFLGWRSILGTTMGHRGEFQAMLRFAQRRTLSPVVDQRFAFEHALSAFEHLAAGRQFGKVVLTIGE
jgi:zinc-binding alcohol dehydrogenase/oxidoreductase